MLSKCKMGYLLALLLAAIVSIQARSFNNPILSEKHFSDPNSLKVNDVYYVVAYRENIKDGVIPISTSTNLKTWKTEGFLFNKTNSPTWANSASIISPSIHQVGSEFLLYFSAKTTSGSTYHVGVAFAEHPLGPYTCIDGPLVPVSRGKSIHPTVIQSEGKLYLVYSNSKALVAQKLTSNGLSLSSEPATELLHPSLPWEEGVVFHPSFVKRGNYHYLIYTGGSKSQNYAVGVARSSNALGPYEKKSEAILVSNKKEDCTRSASIAKDLDNTNDVIFFNTYVNNVWSVFLTPVRWGNNGWPYIGQFLNYNLLEAENTTSTSTTTNNPIN